MNRFAVISLGLYALSMAAVVFGLITARGCAIQQYGTKSADAEWQAWRTEAAQQHAGSGPVRRRTPKSEQPPALMLMNDHFNVCLLLSLLLTTVLFATLALMVRGATCPAGEGSPRVNSDFS